MKCYMIRNTESGHFVGAGLRNKPLKVWFSSGAAKNAIAQADAWPHIERWSSSYEIVEMKLVEAKAEARDA